MTPREADRRLRLLESAVLTRSPRRPSFQPPISSAGRPPLSDGALMRAEQLCRAMAADPGREGQPMGELGLRAGRVRVPRRRSR